jgi:hypothetical protein
VPVRSDSIRGKGAVGGGGGGGAGWLVAGREIFQPFDFHFLIAAATEAVAQLQIVDPEFNSGRGGPSLLPALH